MSKENNFLEYLINLKNELAEDAQNVDKLHDKIWFRAASEAVELVEQKYREFNCK